VRSSSVSGLKIGFVEKIGSGDCREFPTTGWCLIFVAMLSVVMLVSRVYGGGNCTRDSKREMVQGKRDAPGWEWGMAMLTVGANLY
jgi:hypothetical protein